MSTSNENEKKPRDNQFQERTWEWATTGDQNERGCPIEGSVGSRDDAWRAAVLERLEDTEKYPDVEYIVFVQNLDLSCGGAYTVVTCGPGMTWGKAEIEEMKTERMKYHVGDLPSQRMYPLWYISRESHLKQKAENEHS